MASQEVSGTLSSRPTYLYQEGVCPKCNGPTVTHKDPKPDSSVFIVSCKNCDTSFSNVGPVLEGDKLLIKKLPPLCIKEMILL